MAVVRFWNLNDQRPLSTADRRKGYQHSFAIYGKFNRPGFTGSDTAKGFFVIAVELGHRIARRDQRLVGMADNQPFPVSYVGCSMFSYVNIADDIAEGVVFVNPYKVENGFFVSFYGHTHGNAWLPLKKSGRTGG